MKKMLYLLFSVTLILTPNAYASIRNCNYDYRAIYNNAKLDCKSQKFEVNVLKKEINKPSELMSVNFTFSDVNGDSFYKEIQLLTKRENIEQLHINDQNRLIIAYISDYISMRELNINMTYHTLIPYKVLDNHAVKIYSRMLTEYSGYNYNGGEVNY